MPETFDMCVKVGASGEAAQKVTTVQFDDGYKSKMSKGMNNETSEWSVSMTGSKRDINPFVDFLRRHQGAISFYWTPPFEEKGLFTAEGWKTDTHGAGNYTVSTKFERLYAAGTNGELPPDAKPIYTINSNGPNNNGNINLTAAGVGADPAGTASNAIESLKEEENPLPQYALKTDISDVTNINVRLDKEESKITEVETKVTTLNDEIVKTNTNLGALQGTVNEQQKALITINSNVATHSIEIAALKTNVNTLGAHVVDLQTNRVKTVNGFSADKDGNIQLEINAGTEINDIETANNKTWSSQKITTEINNVTDNLADSADLAKGASLIGYMGNLEYPVKTVGRAIKTAQSNISTMNTIISGLSSNQQELTNRVSALEKNTNDFMILYPNGGTEASPANVDTNKRYELANPFPNYHVICIAELLIAGKWGETGWIYVNSANYGVKASMLDLDKIVVVTGNGRIVAGAPDGGQPFPTGGSVPTSAPCRVKVWRKI